MQVLDIIQMSAQEVFIVGHLSGPVVAGPWELRRNGVTVAALAATGEAEVEGPPKGKLTPPRVVVCQGQLNRKEFDFTRDEVELVPLG